MEKTKDIKMTPPTLDILPGCSLRPHVLTLVKVSKNSQMNFPYHTESISQHVNHFKPIEFFFENSAKIINLIFEPFPYATKMEKFTEISCSSCDEKPFTKL